MTAAHRAIHDLWPIDLPWADLGDLPTPVGRLEIPGRDDLWVKRDDLSSAVYGGNKVRTLEVLLAGARARGARRVYAMGAFGSNHSVATALHAPKLDLETVSLLFPQPRSIYAGANLRVSLGHARVVALRHWVTLPYAAWRASKDGYAMPPGGACPDGAVGYVSAALELAQQVDAGALPAPSTIVVAVGSTCTSAGLLLGLHLAAARGLGFEKAPRLVAVRVTPWPVTAAGRIVGLALRTARRLERLTGVAPPTRATLAARLRVDGRFLGAGYGRETAEGVAAIDRFREAGSARLDTVYSAKAGAALLALADAGTPGPLLLWATKNGAPLPIVEDEAFAGAPPAALRWLNRVRGPLSHR